MEPADIHKMVVANPFGLFKLLMVPFVLHKAAQTFQRFIDQVVLGLSFTYAYIDDLLVASSSANECKHHLHAVFHCLDEYGIVINPLKCMFGVKQLMFLRHHISNSGIWPLKAKVQAVRDFLWPNMQHKLREFLGLINFYHWFLNHRAAILKPLNDLLATPTGRKKELVWTDAPLKAFTSAQDTFG